MCCLFGLMSYKQILTGPQKSKILTVLSKECEARGTDATGIAYNSGGKLRIYKRPVPAHKLQLHIPDDAVVIMGHTRMTTQGSEQKNRNNHPFPGRAGNLEFALAHNGVLHNDVSLRKSLCLPNTRIQTDSYIAVQLIEYKKALDLSSLAFMAEQVEGSFSFTVLDGRNTIYFVKLGYIRVSTQEQNTIRQEVLMESLGVEEVYIDRMSGKNTDRPELKKMLAFVRQGDTVIVESISRFARNTKDLLNLVDRLTAKGVEFVSQKESIDTSTPAGKFMLTVFAAVAELEREYLLQRQREGIAQAKAKGKYTGRKPLELPGLDRVLDRWRHGETTAVKAAKELGISKSTFYRLAKRQ